MIIEKLYWHKVLFSIFDFINWCTQWISISLEKWKNENIQHKHSWITLEYMNHHIVMIVEAGLQNYLPEAKKRKNKIKLLNQCTIILINQTILGSSESRSNFTSFINLNNHFINNIFIIIQLLKIIFVSYC